MKMALDKEIDQEKNVFDIESETEPEVLKIMKKEDQKGRESYCIF